MWPKRPASAIIVSATYLLTISSHDIDNVAMSLYDIIDRLGPSRQEILVCLIKHTILMVGQNVPYAPVNFACAAVN